MNWLLKFLRPLNLLPCPLCGDGDGGGDNQFCTACLERLPLVRGKRRCRGCGGELDSALALCSGCISTKARPWSGAVTLMEYRGVGREVIAMLKFGNRPELAHPLGVLGAAALRDAGFPVDVVIPVPLHYTRLLRRSYNQAELVARCIAHELELPLVSGLRRARRRTKQAKLGRRGRWRNLRGVYAPQRCEVWKDRRILLVDDVLTTGATLTAAAGVLLKNGAKEIYVFTCARTPRLASPSPPHF